MIVKNHMIIYGDSTVVAVAVCMCISSLCTLLFKITDVKICHSPTESLCKHTLYDCMYVSERERICVCVRE